MNTAGWPSINHRDEITRQSQPQKLQLSFIEQGTTNAHTHTHILLLCVLLVSTSQQLEIFMCLFQALSQYRIVLLNSKLIKLLKF